jgi:hypothetical protein
VFRASVTGIGRSAVVTAFMVGPEDKAQLKKAIRQALVNPTPWEILKTGLNEECQETDRITLADRKGIAVERHIEQVILPLGWRVAISCEEQPGGRLLHVSMSSPKKGFTPTDYAMLMLVEACGYKSKDIARAWLEEFEPGWNAVNVLILRKN